VSRFAKPAIHIDMLIPLLVMLGAFTCYYGWALSLRVRGEILRYDRNAGWVRDMVRDLGAAA
jgi:heme exporter protein C